ncbi:MAG TPA: HPF/RaiA family ribosome-associated protein, partial [Lacunisphaera sp.]|nr:HPF/RaiA family ribosome-associated protein [Lacunisphaera sp.]
MSTTRWASAITPAQLRANYAETGGGILCRRIGNPTMNPNISSPDKIIMQGIHVDLTPALQEALRSKFETLLRHDPNIIRLNIRLH